jgi:spermidine synthase
LGAQADGPEVLALETVGRATAGEGTELLLYHRDGRFQIRVDGRELMSSRAHGSEQALARIACKGIEGRPAPRVLVGGLGMGYTLRAALNVLPPDASVVVSEVFRAVVEWNRGPLGPLARHPLRDLRVRVEERDVYEVIVSATEAFDAILLDVDNGPGSLTLGSNRRLYASSGIDRTRRALRPGGIVAVWCPLLDDDLMDRLEEHGFGTTVYETGARYASDPAGHAIVVGRRDERHGTS